MKLASVSGSFSCVCVRVFERERERERERKKEDRLLRSCCAEYQDAGLVHGSFLRPIPAYSATLTVPSWNTSEAAVLCLHDL